MCLGERVPAHADRGNKVRKHMDVLGPPLALCTSMKVLDITGRCHGWGHLLCRSSGAYQRHTGRYTGPQMDPSHSMTHDDARLLIEAVKPMVNLLEFRISGRCCRRWLLLVVLAVVSLLPLLLLLLPLCGPRTGSASHAPLRCTQATKCLATKLCGPLLRHYPSRRSNNWTLCVRTRTVVALRGCGATHSPPCLLNNTPHSYGYYHPPLSRTLPETSHPARGMYVQVTCEAGLL